MLSNYRCIMNNTSRGVLNPRPTFLWYLRFFCFLLPFLFKKTVGCFWKAFSFYTNNGATRGINKLLIGWNMQTYTRQHVRNFNPWGRQAASMCSNATNCCLLLPPGESWILDQQLEYSALAYFFYYQQFFGSEKWLAGAETNVLPNWKLFNTIKINQPHLCVLSTWHLHPNITLYHYISYHTT